MSAARRLRILVAEDCEAGAPLALATARIRPEAVLEEAANADEALGAVAQGGVDLALIDFGRPGADGLELAALIRRARSDIPLAVICSQDDAWTRARALDVAFIPRPATEEALAAFLARAELRLTS